MTSWEEFVGGKTIAIVGPAPMLTDQSAEIDAHDLVYRPAPNPVGGWYGTRTNIAYLNGGIGRTILDDDRRDLRALIEGATWWVYKGSKNRQYRPNGLERVAKRPPDIYNQNAVTGMLWDLMLYNPKSITVYGADLYAAGPDGSYVEGYNPPGVDNIETAVQGFLLHRPMEQLRTHKKVHETGLIVGDERYLAAVTMTEQEYQAVIDSWQNAADRLN